MNSLKFRQITRLVRNFGTTTRNDFKVAVIGSSGGIGQPLSLLLKRNKLVSKLSIYDIKKTPGVYADLSHIDTKICIEGFQCAENLPAALEKAHVVMVVGGTARKPGMKREDLFNKNASVVEEIANVVADKCPKALFCIVTNPVNSCVPLAAEVLKKKNVFDPKRLFGITTLDLVRSRTFIAQILGVEPSKVVMPVIGGHSGQTILPVLSQCKPELKLDKEQATKLIKRIQEAGTEVVKAKDQDGGGSATLSMAHAAILFTEALLKGLKGDGKPVKCSYVASDVSDCAYFSTPLQLGKNGVEKNLGLPKLSADEEKLYCIAVEQLKKDIQKGIDYFKKSNKDDKKDKKEKKC
ncbi:PREDICTED: malate dehydrogenase, mitochondrial-like [Bactrocera latifrons]|uniref:malate dehydrogenase, mitochondrial-like n=1 Tax=Bactrocera latifrons TaxID=174628 RepID=UPI0008DD6770|nr:PREDICTED: malate dehydrogenase, mitochondrial-like [Bactrocera latifrons]